MHGLAVDSDYSITRNVGSMNRYTPYDQLQLISAIEKLYVGHLPQTDEEKVALCFAILLKNVDKTKEEKIILLRKLLCEIVEINWVLDVEKNDVDIDSIAASIDIMREAFSGFYGDQYAYIPEKSYEKKIYPIEMLLALYHALKMHMVSLDMADVCIDASFEASEQIPPGLKLKKCSFKIISSSYSIRKYFVSEVLPQLTQLTSLCFEKCRLDFLERMEGEKLSLIEKIFINNHALEKIEIIGTLIGQKIFDSLSTYIQQAVSLKELCLEKNTSLTYFSGRRYFDANQTTSINLISTIFDNRYLKKIVLNYKACKQWFATPENRDIFFDKLKHNTVLRHIEFSGLCLEKFYDDEAEQEKLLTSIIDMLRYNATVVTFPMDTIVFLKASKKSIALMNRWLKGNQLVLCRDALSDTSPEKFPADYLLCLHDLPTEVVNIMLTYILLQGYNPLYGCSEAC